MAYTNEAAAKELAKYTYVAERTRVKYQIYQCERPSSNALIFCSYLFDIRTTTEIELPVI